MKGNYHLESIQNSQYWKRNMLSQCVICHFQIGETYFEHFAFFLIALWKFSFSEKITIAHFKTFHDSYRKFVAKISPLRNIQFQTNLYLPLQFKLTLHFKNKILLRGEAIRRTPCIFIGTASHHYLPFSEILTILTPYFVDISICMLYLRTA